MQSFVDDIRLAQPLLLDNPKEIENVLVRFLAYILGDFCEVYTKEDGKTQSTTIIMVIVKAIMCIAK